MLGVSCHHGDVNNQNNLKAAARIIRDYPEIDIVEIDFVFYGNDLISSHDYDARLILRGSSLIKWIERVVFIEKKILWIDLKPKLDPSVLIWPVAKEETRCLFAILNEAMKKEDIRSRIIITSQDMSIVDEIEASEEASLWQIAADIPNIPSYVWQDLLPPGLQGWLNSSVNEHFIRRCDLTPYNIVAIDKSFFDDMTTLMRFIHESSIKQGATIIIYTFKRGAPLITSDHYNIVMQYDFA